MKENRSEEGINTRLRELAEGARNVRRDLEQDQNSRVRELRRQANERPPRDRRKR